jgi:hypothetical protein
VQKQEVKWLRRFQELSIYQQDMEAWKGFGMCQSCHMSIGTWVPKVPTKLFFAYLFADHERAVQFLKDVGLLKNLIKCRKCDAYTVTNRTNTYKWQCTKVSGKGKCSNT